MEIAGHIITIILLGVIFFYQKYKINSLEAQIKSQKGILDSAETFFKFFDLEKLKGYGEMVAEKAKLEKEIEITKVKANLEERVKKERDASKFLTDEFLVLLRGFVNAFPNLPTKLRKEIIDRMKEGFAKKLMEGVNQKIEDIDNKFRKKALSGVIESSGAVKVDKEPSLKE